jgi:hypothetical protein
MHERPNISPCLLYVGTKDGVYVFYMEGDRLSLVGRGIEKNAVRGIAIHPNNPEIAYVGCCLGGWGLHYTKDAGKSWESLGFKDLWVWDVIIHPSDCKTILVGTEPPMIYISKDEGSTFKAFSSTKYYGNVKALEGITLSIKEGEIFTILGPNGAARQRFSYC